MKPYYWAILTALTWGLAPILEKLGLAKIPVWPGLFFRTMGVFVGCFLLVLFKFDEIKQGICSLPSGWYYLLAGGLCASIVGQIFFYNALKTGEASKMIPLAGAYPLLSFILGLIVFKEHLTLAKALGVGCVVLGVFLLR